MFTPFYLLFIFMLVFSSLVSLSSSTWLGAWLGLEFNLMSFVPLMILSSGKSSSEGILKYFLVQAFSSLLFVVSLILFMYYNGLVMAYHYFMLMAQGFIAVPLMIKLGAAPFHMWFPAVSSSLDWTTNFILMTWQKLVPLVLIYYVMTFSIWMITIVLLSAAIGSVGGLMQTSLRKLMAYSSINHLSWMIISACAGISLLLLYFFIYALINFILVSILNMMNLYYLSQLYFVSNGVPLILLFVNLFSFGGLPPFLGFLPKWLVLDYLVSLSCYGVSFTMVMFSLVSLFYYVRLGYSVFSQSGVLSLVHTFPGQMKFSVVFISGLSLLGLVFMPLLVVVI